MFKDIYPNSLVQWKAQLLIISLFLVVVFANSIFSNLNVYEFNTGSGMLNNAQSKADVLETSAITRASDYNFIMICENNTHVTNGGDPTGYLIEIENTGILVDTITIVPEIISVTGGSEPKKTDWYALVDKDRVTLGPGEKELITLTIASSCGCQEGSTATTRLTGQSVNAPLVNAYIDTYTTYGAQEGTVRLELRDYTIFSEIKAGQLFNFTLRIYNLQSVTQSYLLKNTFNPARWPIEFNDQPFEIEAKSLKDIIVKISFPLINEVGWYNLSFTVQSDRDPNIKDSVNIPVRLLPELTVTEFKSAITTPIVNKVVNFQVTIRNLGPAAARNFYLNFYNNTEFTDKYLVDSIFVESLFSYIDLNYNLTWMPEVEGEYNLTAYVNPINMAEIFIMEMSSRYFNNIKTITMTVQGIEPPPNDNNGDNSTGSNKEDNEQFFWIIVGATALVIFVLLGVFISRRLISKKYVEKTAKKIPLSSDMRVQGRTRTSKTAHKEKLTGYRTNLGRGQPSRARSKYANRAAQRKKYRK